MRRSTRSRKARAGRDRRQAPDRFGGQLERHGRRRQDRDRRARRQGRHRRGRDVPDRVRRQEDGRHRHGRTARGGRCFPGGRPAEQRQSRARRARDPGDLRRRLRPAGLNGIGGAVGGPDEGGADESYPACTATVTDNCIQLYERGVRASLASAPTAKLEEESSRRRPWAGPCEPVGADTDDWR